MFLYHWLPDRSTRADDQINVVRDVCKLARFLILLAPLAKDGCYVHYTPI